MPKQLLFIIFGFFLIHPILNIYGQSKAVSELVEGAAVLYEQDHQYFNALNYYLEAYNLSNDHNLVLNIAHCYRKLRNYSEASKWYLKVEQKKLIAQYPEAKYWLAKMYIAQGLYIDAKYVLDEFINSYKGDKDILLAADLAYFKCNYAIKSIQNPVHAKVENIGEPVNSKLAENNAIFFKEDSYVFSRLVKRINDGERSIPALKYSDLDDNDTIYRTRLYSASKLEEEWITKPCNYFPTMEGHELVGTPALFQSRSIVYMSLRKKGSSSVYIYRAQKEDGSWSKLKKVHSKINFKDSRNIHPFAFKFGYDEVLFYASDKKGGEGGYDIYYAVFDERGKFIRGQNLGSTYNTEFDEVTPSYDLFNQYLYFSSEGYEGLGQLDIFKLEGNVSDGWDEVENLGYPINSSADDYFYFYDAQKDNGYLSSNRKSDLNLSSSYDDIYRFKYKYETEVIDFKTTIRFYDHDNENPIDDLILIIYNKADTSFPIYKYRARKNEFKISFSLSNKNDYIIKVKKDGFESLNLDVSVNKFSVVSTSQKMTYFFSNDEDSESLNALKANVFMDHAPSSKSFLKSQEETKSFDRHFEEKQDITLEEFTRINEEKAKAKELNKTAVNELDGIDINKFLAKVNKDKAYFKLIEDFPYKRIDNVDFRIQVGAYEDSRKTYFNFLNRFGTVGEEKNGSLYKYVIGSYNTIDDAREYLEQIKMQGIKDAFICAYYNNKRISMKEVYKIFYLHE